MRYKYKAVWSGDVVELYEYEYGVAVGEVVRNRYGTGPPDLDDREKAREKALQRARRELRRLINANVGRHGDKDVFLTLTFAENVTDVKKANYEFKKFRQRLEYMLETKLKYVCVVEFQKRGAVHYHILFFGLPYVPAEAVREIWGNGYIKLNAIDNVDNVGAYVTKYMSKSMIDDERLRGLKSYFCSRGLYKPLVKVLEKEEIDRLRSGLEHKKVYENEFASEYVGKVRYQQYNLKKTKNVTKKVKTRSVMYG